MQEQEHSDEKLTVWGSACAGAGAGIERLLCGAQHVQEQKQEHVMVIKQAWRESCMQVCHKHNKRCWRCAQQPLRARPACLLSHSFLVPGQQSSFLFLL
jgi:hypothetical protein